ncbi:DUF1524 domain-containing protein, partial [Candidatus Saccharibacteria bacterium]|nr:DUF1524 domain-containing protein [Candidatus Saccharibacteria bacterium]
LFDVPIYREIDSDNLDNEIPRLTPPRADRSRFHQIIQGHEVGTNGKLVSAWSDIVSFLLTLKESEFETFFDFVTQKVEITILYIPDTEDANAVFEALNARGKPLEDIDLIRNHIYSYFSRDNDAQQYEAVHSSIEDTLAALRSAKRAQDYFRCYLQNRYGYLQKTRFYRNARVAILHASSDRTSGQQAKNYVLALVNDLTNLKNVELFRTIFSTNPNPDFLLDFNRASRTNTSKRNLSVFLDELRGYSVTYPLLFALLRRFTSIASYQRATRRPVAVAVHRAIADLTTFIMRTSFVEGKFEPSRVEPALANCAQRIASGIGSTDAEDLDILDDLSACDTSQIMSEANFIDRLKNARLTDRRRAKRLLFGVNGQQQRDATALSYQGCSVEHILPQSAHYWPGWREFGDSGPDLSDWVPRLGNLTLLGHNDNYSRGRFNASFESKRPVFADSPFTITKDLARHSQWSPAAVDARSQDIARMAARVWRFSRPAPVAGTGLAAQSTGGGSDRLSRSTKKPR